MSEEKIQARELFILTAEQLRECFGDFLYNYVGKKRSADASTEDVIEGLRRAEKEFLHTSSATRNILYVRKEDLFAENLFEPKEILFLAHVDEHYDRLPECGITDRLLVRALRQENGIMRHAIQRLEAAKLLSPKAT